MCLDERIGTSTNPDPWKDVRLEDEDCARLGRAPATQPLLWTWEHSPWNAWPLSGGLKWVSWRVFMAPRAFHPQRGRQSLFLAPSDQKRVEFGLCCSLKRQSANCRCFNLLLALSLHWVCSTEAVENGLKKEPKLEHCSRKHPKSGLAHCQAAMHSSDAIWTSSLHN